MSENVWISERGPGPLLVVRAMLLPEWRGVAEVPGVRARSDYARACAVGEVGCVDVGGGTALVLGDDPLRTTWLPKAEGGMLVRWVAADDEASALAVTAADADATWTPTGCVFTTEGGSHVLFGASLAGREADVAGASSLRFELGAGDYNVSSAILDEPRATMLVYRLIKRLSKTA